jgi:hypothetical protein
MKINMQQTSLDAWDRWQGKPSNLVDGLILKALYEAGPDGLMCWQIEKKIDREHQTVSGNLRHIVERGGAFRLDKRGKAPSGRGAYYWVHRDFRPKVCVTSDASAALYLQQELWI